MAEPFDIRQAFASKQEHMLTGFGVMRQFTEHSTAKGDSNEGGWIEMLREFLPRRYGVGRAIAIDSRDQQSQQIDIAIFDQQYSPLFFEQNGHSFVPIESIYAVFEVKPKLDARNLEYARDKVASVRGLHRTSQAIRHAGGYFKPQDPASKEILGGILAIESDWVDLKRDAARTAILGTDQRVPIDFAGTVSSGAVERVGADLVYAPPSSELIWFAWRLFKRLAAIGTVLALDLDAYGKSIEMD